jgi:uncharacterized protein HemY
VTKKAVEMAKQNIAGLSKALTQSNCQQQYDEIVIYLHALADYGAIKDEEFKTLSNAANAGLAAWKDPSVNLFF